MTKYEKFVTRLLRGIANATNCHNLRIVLENAYETCSANGWNPLGQKCLFMVGEVAENLYGGRIHVLAQIAEFVDV